MHGDKNPKNEKAPEAEETLKAVASLETKVYDEENRQTKR